MIAVLTCPRPVDYLTETLRQIDSSSASRNKIIFSDGHRGIAVPSGWSLIETKKPKTERQRSNRVPFWFTMQVAADMKEDLIFFEDDVTLSRSAARFAEDLIVPLGVSLLSLYAPFGDRETKRGIEIKSAESFMFCQAMKIPLHTCVLLCAMRNEMMQLEDGGSDACLNKILSSMHLDFGTLYPGIVQHSGDFSAVMGVQFGRFKSSAFAGVDFDAMSLSPLQETRRM